MIKEAILALSLIFLLTNCATVEVYGPPPSTCEGIMDDMVSLGADRDKILAARGVKEIGAGVASGAVALGYIPQISAVFIPIIYKLKLDDEGRRQRIENLFHAYDRRGCFKTE